MKDKVKSLMEMLILQVEEKFKEKNVSEIDKQSFPKRIKKSKGN